MLLHWTFNAPLEPNEAVLPHVGYFSFRISNRVAPGHGTDGSLAEDLWITIVAICESAKYVSTMYTSRISGEGGKVKGEIQRAHV